MSEAEKLADSMDDEIAQAGRVSNHNGMLAAALLRGQAEQIKELRDALSEAIEPVAAWPQHRGQLLGKMRLALSNTKDQ